MNTKNQSKECVSCATEVKEPIDTFKGKMLKTIT